MRAAVVDLATLIVVNVIVADAAIDVAPVGCLLVNTDGSCGIGWIYDPVVNDFTNPNPPSQPRSEPEDEPDFDDEGSG